MQGSFFFLDLNSKAVIKHRKFVEFPMPDSVTRKLEAWGRKDKQDGRLRFCNRNNDPFEWLNEHEEALIMDNAPEPEEAMYPDVPAEVPGVVLEAHVPAVSTPPAPT